MKFFYAALGIALFALLLHYFFLLESRSRQIRTKNLFDRSFFLHPRGYTFDGSMRNIIHIGPFRSRFRSNRTETIDQNYFDSALGDALLELFATESFFPPTIFLHSTFAVEFTHFSHFSKYPVQHIDARALLTWVVTLQISGNHSLRSILLPDCLREILDFLIMDCPNLSEIVFTGKPPVFTLGEEYKRVATGVAKDFHFSIPKQYAENYSSSVFAHLQFSAEDNNTLLPIPIVEV